MSEPRQAALPPFLVIFGIIVCVALPPVAVICFVIAFVVFMKRRMDQKSYRRHAAWQAYERGQRERILAFKSLR